MSKLPKIMIADDMQMMRRLLKSSLLKAGFADITEAINGEELLTKLDEQKFDLIICDWDMPKMSGYDALQFIRKHDAHKNIPFVMVTAVADSEKVKQAIQMGINDYIIKPIKPEHFVDKVKNVLSKLDVAVPAAT
ncbi:MAG: response regulator [Gammaproteobacteria bacterium]|nr:response regulator [Gammaproteobacteria bacterium]